MVNKFLNLIILVFVLAGISIGLTPLVDGYFLKQRYTDYIDALNSTFSSENIVFKIKNYQLGWLKSNITLEIQAKSSKTLVTVEQIAHHGPYVYDIKDNQYKPMLGIIDSKADLTNVPNAPTAHLQSNITLNGKIHTFFSVDPIQNLVTNTYKVLWEGLSGDNMLKYRGNDLAQITTAMTLGKLTLTSPNSSIQFDAINIDSTENKESSDAPWVGVQHINLPSVDIVNQNANKLSILNLDITTNSNLKNGLFNTNTTVNISTIQTSNYTVQPINLNLSLENINTKALMQFAKNDKNDKVIDNAYQLITAKTNLNGHLSLGTNIGNLVADAKVYWPEASALPSNMDEFKKGVSYSFKFTISSLLLNNLLKDYSASAEKSSSKQAINNEDEDQNQTQDDIFNQTVAAYIKDGKINVNDSLSIMALEKEHLSANDFNNKLDQMKLNIPADAIVQLKQIYAHLDFNTAVKSAPQDPAAVMIDNYVKQGYLIKNDDNYTITIEYSQGQMKINGQAMPLPALPGTL